MILKYQQFQHWAILLHLQLQVRLKILKKTYFCGCLWYFLLNFLDDGPATKEKPPRQVKIQSEVKDSLKIDFDIDLGLLMTSIPKKEDVDEDVTKAWDWDQQFSQLNAEFVTGKSL